MKLKEYLAKQLSDAEVHPASETSQAWFEVGYCAGFDQAVRLALYECVRIHDDHPIAQDIAKRIDYLINREFGEP